MSQYTVIYNQQAGKNDNEKIAQHFQKAASNHGDVATLVATTSRQGAIEYVTSHIDQFDTIVTIGGDGSINTIFSAFLQAQKSVPVGIIPGGTINNFAKALQLPLDEEAAIQNILTGTTQSVDLVHTEDRAIISSLTLGTLADMARNVGQDEKKKWGPLIYLIKGIQQLVSKKSYYIEIKVPGVEPQIYRTRFLLATTTQSIGGFTNFDTNAAPDDGKIHLVVLKRFSAMRLLGYLHYFLTGRFRHIQDVDQVVANHIEISTFSPHIKAETRIDGDPSDRLPIVLDVEPEFIDIIVPASPN